MTYYADEKRFQYSMSGNVQSSAYPKVLIINQQSMNKENATGITMRSLWEEWPVASMLEIYLDANEKHVTNGKKFRTFTPSLNIARKFFVGNIGSKVNRSLKTNTPVLGLSKTKKYLRQCCVCAVDSFPVGLSRAQAQMVDEFQPEVIYSLGASVATMQLAHKLSHRYGIPIIIHYMDNWPEYLQWEDNILLKPYARILRRYMDCCLKHSRNGIAISPSMAKHYTKEFELPFEVLMNAVDEPNMQFVSTTSLENSLHFVYAGGLHLERWKALREIAEAINTVCENAVLDIYTPEKDRILYESCFSEVPVVFHQAVPHEQMKDVWASGNILVHAESSSNKTLVRFFKYSISTKIPEYMATGKPILFYGPKEMGLYEYLEENKVAVVAANKDELCNAIRQLMQEDVVNVVTRNAYNLVRMNHSAAYARKKLLDTVRMACAAQR